MPAKRQSPKKAPSLDDMIAAINAINADREPKLVEKYIGPAIVAILMGLIAWFASRVVDLSTTVTTLNVTVSALVKSVDDVRSGQSGSSKVASDLQADVAATKATDVAIKEDLNRVKERVRILEGQKPLDLSVSNGAR